MKYLMGLILSFTLGAAAIAQDTKNENCEDETTTGKESEVIYGDTEQGFTKMERVDENGSVYYYDDPSVKVESDEAMTPKENGEMESEAGAELELNQEETDTDLKTEMDAEVDLKQEGAETEMKLEGADAEASTEGSVFTFGNECSLNGLLDDNVQGKYKYKQELDNGAELKVERESDGDGQVKYESDSEYYTYDKDENGESQYSHGVAKENESVEILKNKDGSVDVYYQGHFNNLDEARVLEEGIKFENVESVCNQ